jgi:hypothetical protein
VKRNLNPNQAELYLKSFNISKIFKTQSYNNKINYLLYANYLIQYIIGIFYLIFKKFQYLPYRNLRNIEGYKRKFLWFAPSYRLEEFSDKQNLTNGAIWGSVKFINESANNSCYALIPYLEKKFKTHYSQSRTILHLNKTTQFKIYPLAAGLTLATMMKVLIEYQKCSSINFKILKKLNKENSGLHLNIGLVNCLNGKNLAEVLLNQKLIDNFNEKINKNSIIFANCEGQPWEISLRFSNFEHKNVLLNLVFSLPDIENSSDLKNHLIFPFKDNIKILTGFSENIDKLNTLTKNLVLVEPQRFINSNSEYQFKNSVHKVLYFCDLNNNRTLNFFKLVDDFSKTYGNIIFGVKFHPATKNKRKRSKSKLIEVIQDIKEFDPDTFIFGANTSSIIQSEYRFVRKFIYQENQQNNSSNPIIREIKTISSLDDLKYNLKESKDYSKVKIEIDANLTQWNKIIYDSLKDWRLI